MNGFPYPRGATSVRESFRLLDSSQAAITTLAHNTAGLVAEYRRSDQSTWTTITLVAGTLGAWVSGGFSHDKDGIYELDIPNAAFTSGDWVMVRLSGSTISPAVTKVLQLSAGNLRAMGDAAGKVASQDNATGYNKVIYFSKAGNDSNDGLTPSTAKLTLTNAVINAQPAGTLIIVGPGAFTLGSPGRLVFPDYVSMRGAGMYATTITGTSAALNDTTIKPGTGSVFEDFTLVSAQDSVQFDYPFGTATKEELDPDFDYTELRRVRIVGDADCIIVRYQGRIRCVDCQLESKYDAIVGASTIYELHNTNIRIVGPGAPGSHLQQTARGIYDVGRLFMYGGSISVRDGGNAEVSGIHASASTLSMDLFGVKIATSNSGSASPKDIIVDAGTVRLFGCEFDASKTTGTYTSLNVPTAVQIRQEMDTNSTKLDSAASAAASAASSASTAAAQATNAASSAATAVTQTTQQALANATNVAPAGAAAAGSVQAKLDDAGGGGDAPTADEIADEVESRLAGRDITISGPIYAEDDETYIDIVAGDEYTSGNALAFTATGYAGPSLNGKAASLRFIDLRTYDRTRPTDAEADLVLTSTASQTGTTVTVTFSPTSTQTAELEGDSNLSSPNYQAQLVVALDSDSDTTLKLMKAYVRRPIKE